MWVIHLLSPYVTSLPYTRSWQICTDADVLSEFLDPDISPCQKIASKFGPFDTSSAALGTCICIHYSNVYTCGTACCPQVVLLLWICMFATKLPTLSMIPERRIKEIM
ncbi:hypothetical protein EDB86DRAFT_2987716 [Lactarius hatsudake]|nr:hypothetical protein EDB86DRAFT_2995134 [Lactarius hatsudake]KAH8979156.1 hypothetical protein EDB86DRAFT_2987716 [Lactarius hatsudake]